MENLGEKEPSSKRSRVLALLQQSPLGEATLAGRHWLAGGGSHRDAVSVAAVAVLVWSGLSGRQETMQLFQLPVCSAPAALLKSTRLKSAVPCRLASRTP